MLRERNFAAQCEKERELESAQNDRKNRVLRERKFAAQYDMEREL